MSADLASRSVTLDESALHHLAQISHAAKRALFAEQTKLRRERAFMTYRAVAATEREIERLFKVVAFCSNAVGTLPEEGLDARCRHLQDALAALARMGGDFRAL
jgi:hypothetical protein